MLEVTESAISNINEYLAKNKIDSAIRVVIQNGCGGASLSLNLDEKRDSDQVFTKGGITFLVDDGMFATTGAIKVDFIKSTSGCGCGGGGGFAMSSEKHLGGGGCSSGSCSSGSYGC
ncbi:MAG: IscA/HesB family protein [Desulfurivibrionaceae bacterium]